MIFQGGTSGISEVPEGKKAEGLDISEKTSGKFDILMGDDNVKEKPLKDQTGLKMTPAGVEKKFSSLFEKGDVFENSTVNTERVSAGDDIKTGEKDESSEQPYGNQEPDYSEKREPNSTYELNGNTYETDDNGQIYKKNGEILPNTEYTVNGNKYKTDRYGNKISCDSKPEYTEEGSRNMKDQQESGGEDREKDDDGGHIIARILGGADGEENLVPMRRTINRGDYKRMENEIAKALQEGKDVTIHIDIEYDGDSSRPSKIRVEYTIDGKKTVCEFDNEEGSSELLDSLHDKISDEDYDRLKQTVKEMDADGCNTAITSVKVEYDENGEPMKVTVGMLDESTGTKTYKEYDPR